MSLHYNFSCAGESLKKWIVIVALACWAAPSMAKSLGKESYIEYGIASYYADMFQGRTTANGESFDQAALTAAHRSLPFGTKVLVTRQDTGQSVEVTINDRGPFVKGRIIDLSKQAARELGMIHRGIVPVALSSPAGNINKATGDIGGLGR